MRTILGMIGGFLSIMMIGIIWFSMQVSNSTANLTTQAMTSAIQATSVQTRNTTSKTETLSLKTVKIKSLNAFMANYFNIVNSGNTADKQQNRSNTSFDFLLTSGSDVKVVKGVVSPGSTDLTLPISIKAVKVNFTDNKGINYQATSALTGASLTKVNTPFALNTPTFTVPSGTAQAQLLSLEPQFGALYYDAGGNTISGNSTVTTGSNSNSISTTISNSNGDKSTLNQTIPVDGYAPILSSPKQVTIIAGGNILVQASATQMGPNGTSNVPVTSSTINNTVAGTVIQTLTAKNTVTGITTTFTRQLVILPDLAVFKIQNASIGTFDVGSGLPSSGTLLSGIKATLPLEGNANSLITISTTAVKPNVAGTYTITYQVTSPVSSAFTATATRTITYK